MSTQVAGVGGAPLSVHAKGLIIHLHFNLDMPEEAVARFVPSPRGAPQLDARTVRGVLDSFVGGDGTFGPEKRAYKERVDKKIKGVVLATLIAIAEESPWLFLD